MKSGIKIISVIVLLTLPLVAFAALNPLPRQPAGYPVFTGCDSVVNCIVTVITILLALVFIVALVFLVIGGFRYILSQGNEEAVEKAKGTIVNAIIGLVIVLLSWIILVAVQNMLERASP